MGLHAPRRRHDIESSFYRSCLKSALGIIRHFNRVAKIHASDFSQHLPLVLTSTDNLRVSPCPSLEATNFRNSSTLPY